MFQNCWATVALPPVGDGDMVSPSQVDDVLLTHTDQRVRTLTLNRPDARNALSSALRSKLFSALAEADNDDEVDVVILTGTDPAFCAGLDLRELAEHIPDLSLTWPLMTKPVIGAINGVTVTGGLEIALCCDVLIASERARFADTHARVGLLPGWGMSVRLPMAVGSRLARRLTLTGDFLSAKQALAAGLVTEVVAHDELADTARSLAAAIVGSNQATVRAVLATYRRIEDLATREGLAIEAESATRWLHSHVTSESIAINRAGVLERGRDQLRLGD